MDRKRTRLSPTARRQQLLETGVAILGKLPPEELTPNRVADEAGVSRALVFHYFPTTETLRLACASSIVDRWIEHMGTAAAASQPDTLIDDLVTSFVDFVEESPRCFQSVLALSAWDADLALHCEQARQILIDAALEEAPGHRGAVVAMIARGWEAMAEQTTLAWAQEPDMEKARLTNLLLVVLRSSIAAPDQLTISA